MLSFHKEYQKKKESTDKWNNMTTPRKFYSFMASKLGNMKYGLRQIYMAMTVILELDDSTQPPREPLADKKGEL